ncbi:MAG: MBL fold metallo-hydrolase [Alphaproteobacteria bacterium]|nr:MBL fold metallo-hydrolase [Alphaproteobacteria bacterium]
MPDDRFYLRQLRAGADFGQGDPIATQMANFIYLVGDRVAGECLVVDPAWDIRGILDAAAEDDMKVVGALVTHYHPDHIGGPLFGYPVQGLPELLAANPCPVHVHEAEAHGVRVVTGLERSDLVTHSGGDAVQVGAVEVECLHTPGHTPGSQCFRCKGALIAGDTLFLQGCGRVDLPGGDPEQMRLTLTQRLAKLPGSLRLYPGHSYGEGAYGDGSALMSDVRRKNPALRSIGAW